MALNPSQCRRYRFLSNKEWTRGKYIGSGSYGSVYLAVPRSPLLPLLVAKSSLFKNSDSLQKEYRILREICGCSEIVQSYAYCLSLDPKCKTVYDLLLEYAAGGSLCDLMMKYGGKMPESDVRQYTRMLLRGLSWIHKNGYVHCDLKPANILVFPSHQHGGLSQLKIADFGLAKEPDEEEQPKKRLFRGTPLYMSPESVSVGEITPALDIWSLGCVVVEMMTGKPAWGADLTMEQLFVNLAFTTGISPVIPYYMSEQGKDFLKMCFKRDANERWTADMLLNHPFIVDQHLTSLEEQLSLNIESIVEFVLSSPPPLYRQADRENTGAMVGQTTGARCY